jgi:hypothetical protein
MRTIDDMKRFLRQTLLLSALPAMFACGDSPPATAQFITPVFGNQCAHFSCSGQGDCMPRDNVEIGPICSCNAGFAGNNCERCAAGYHRDSNERCVLDRLCKGQAKNPCGAHGTCSDGDGVVFCNCDLGYEGPRCTLCTSGFGRNPEGDCLQQVILNGKTVSLPPTCGLDSCNSHGQCRALDTTFECDCYPGYEGRHCEECSAGYKNAPGVDRCEPSSGCQAPACGGCIVFDGARGFPDDPDTCNSSSTLTLDDLTVNSSGGDGTLWLCAQSGRYPLTSEHVAVEAGSSQPARIAFSRPVRHITFDFVPWDAFDLEVLADDQSVLKMQLKRYIKSTIDLKFDPAISVLALRTDDVFAHAVAIDNVVYEMAPDQCP